MMLRVQLHPYWIGQDVWMHETPAQKEVGELSDEDLTSNTEYLKEHHHQDDANEGIVVVNCNRWEEEDDQSDN